MPTLVVPNSYGSTPLREFNPNHSPRDGKFTATLYHGSNVSGISKFASTYGAVVAWFSDTPNLARQYAGAKAQAMGGTPTVYTAHVTLRQPLTIRGDMNVMTTYAAERKATGLTFTVGKYGDESVDGVEQKYKRYQILTSPEFVSAAKAKGFTGLKVTEGGKTTWGVFDAAHAVIQRPRKRLREFNPNHSPRDGKFTSGTSVGITSAKGDRSNTEVFRTMRVFEHQLKALSGVSNVRVQPGLGAWKGGSESTWVVSYRGNGAATKLLAQTGKRYKQDAVLMMKGCHGRTCDPAVDLRFDKGVSLTQRTALEGILTAHGMGGWTWLKSEGKTVLRMVSVPAWGGSRQKHVRATREISVGLTKLGLTHRLKIKMVRATVLDASNYDIV